MASASPGAEDHAAAGQAGGGTQQPQGQAGRDQQQAREGPAGAQQRQRAQQMTPLKSWYALTSVSARNFASRSLTHSHTI